MICRITHGQHSFREIIKFFGKQVILKKVLLNPHISRKIRRNPGSKVTITQPAGSLAGRTIHEGVENVLAESLACRLKEPVKPLVAGVKGAAPHPWVGVLAEVNVL